MRDLVAQWSDAALFPLDTVNKTLLPLRQLHRPLSHRVAGVHGRRNEQDDSTVADVRSNVLADIDDTCVASAPESLCRIPSILRARMVATS